MRVTDRQRGLAKTRLNRTDGYGMLLQTFVPEIQAAGGNCQGNFAAQTVTFAARRHLCPREKGEVRSGMTLGVGIEKMIGAGIVLVDALLHEPHSKNAGIEIEVL